MNDSETQQKIRLWLIIPLFTLSLLFAGILFTLRFVYHQPETVSQVEITDQNSATRIGEYLAEKTVDITAILSNPTAISTIDSIQMINETAAPVESSETPSVVATIGLPTNQSGTLPNPTTMVQPTKTATSTGLVIPVSQSLPLPKYGVETHDLNYVARLDKIDDAGLGLVRFNALLWSDVESIQGERNWNAVAELENGLREASKRGLSVILIVRSTPLWAQQKTGVYCGPIAREHFDDFANFMKDVVARYKDAPYNVKYWEIGNEPDVAPELVAPDNQFGCWGDENDPYYGGGYYADILEEIYPRIKQVDPDAKVLLGGLLLDCDPTNPPDGKDCKPSKFFEGILRNDGASFFDVLSFHGYAPFNGTLELDEAYPGWEERGGVIIGKIDYLRELMETYTVSKPLFHTESALLCPEYNKSACDPPKDDFYELQADYLVRLFIRNWAYDVSGTIWYQLEGPGWRHSGLLNDDDSPKRSYLAMQFLMQKLGSGILNGSVVAYQNLQGYEFRVGDKKVWVLWTKDNEAHTITLVTGVINIYDKYGDAIIPYENEITVYSPVYLEMNR